MPGKSHLKRTPKSGENVPAPSLESIISQHPFLAGLSPHQLRLLSDCAMPAQFATGELKVTVTKEDARGGV